MKESISSQANFSFRFEGGSSIDTMLLADTLQNFNELATIILRETSPGSSVHLNVSAFSPGSFLIEFEAALNSFYSLVAPVLADANYVVSIICGIMELKKLFGSKRPSKIQSTSDGMAEITDENDQKYNFPQPCTSLFKNAVLDKCVVNIAGNVIIQGSGCTIGTPNHTAHYDATDLDRMSQQFSGDDAVQASTRKIIVEVVRPVLQGNADWGLRINGQNIRASIEDKDFLERVHKKLVYFMTNDKLEVDLRTTFQLDAIGLPTPGSERYFVDHVYGDVMRDTGQISMFDSIS